MKQLITIFVMLLVSSGYVFGFQAYESARAQKKTSVINVHEGDKALPKTVQVCLKRVYLGGQTMVDVKPVTIWSMEDFRSRYSGWQLVEKDTDRIVFQKKIHDLSPLLKASGYFGISPDGILTIYKGKPHEDKAIHSFFQIDMKKLESGMQQELQRGIPIHSTDHYERVLKTLKQYAVK